MSCAGKLSNAEVTAIGAGSVRLDLLASVPPTHDRDDRYTAILDLNTAHALAILLIRAIEKAEVEQARSTKRKKK